MTPASPADWNPEAYARFRGLRLRPALDLLGQVGALPDGPIVDLGCGSGAVAEALALRFPDHARIGVDNSPSMLAKAAETGAYTRLSEGDIGTWTPDRPAALIFSNAALHWLDDHETLMPRLAGALAPGGTLAVQMPRQFLAPSHRFLRDIAASLFPDRFDFAHYDPPVKPAHWYWELLAGLGRVDAWETEYVQQLEPGAGMHPVRNFTASTAMRPIVDKLTPSETAEFEAAYDAALNAAYPPLADGSVLFPFRRVFFTVLC